MSILHSSLSCSEIAAKYLEVRKHSTDICEPLALEDYVVQPCAEVSPPKWHLGHTTWFFEELILVQFAKNNKRWDEGYRVLFNSYYKSAGQHWLQGERGCLSRPTVDEVFRYRRQVDERITSFILEEELSDEALFLIEVGLNHEQQHQELLLMDIKYILAQNPSLPGYSTRQELKHDDKSSQWIHYDEGVYEFGDERSEHRFTYDNERPHHKSYIHPFAMRDTLVSNGEYLEFIQAGGYERSDLWLSKGWDWVNQEKITKPLYWLNYEEEFTLAGKKTLNIHGPVSHISYYEADAFARWCGQRLPTEFELELYGQDNLKDPGELWSWSRSHYSPYPGFQEFKGMIGEYNGKFMCNQFVLKGGCHATPTGHYRHTYRNFYEPHQRWMFSGIRLAKDL